MQKSVAAVVAVVALAGVSVGAPSLIVEYDVATGWDGSKVVDTSSNGRNPLVPSTDPDAWVSPPGWAGPPIPGSEFAMPQYVPNGAGPADRPYIDLDKYGQLGAWPGASPSAFGAAGYTEVFYLNIGSDLGATSNAAIGAIHNTSYQNIPISITGGGSNLNSYTVLQDSGTYVQAASNLNSILTRDEWLHLVKVHDRAANEVRFYVNNSLVLTTPFDPGAGTWSYVDRGDHLGSAGFDPYWAGGRQIRGVGYSYFAAYDGVFTVDDVAASYEALATAPVQPEIPEPLSALTVLLGAGLLVRRRRKA